MSVQGSPWLEVISAQRALKAALRRLPADQPLLAARGSEAPVTPGLLLDFDAEAAVRDAVSSVGRQATVARVIAQLDEALDALAQANRMLLYDDVIDDVEVATASVLVDGPLPRALTRLVPVARAPSREGPRSPAVPGVPQVRWTERWLGLLSDCLAPDMRRGLTLPALLGAARSWVPVGSVVAASVWSRSLLALEVLARERDAQDLGLLIARAAQYWAGQDTAHPFPDENENGVADEVGVLQRAFDAFADVARAADPSPRWWPPPRPLSAGVVAVPHVPRVGRAG